MNEISNEGSLKKSNLILQIILSIITLLLSCFHLALYRKIVNINSNYKYDFKTELFIFSWRYQIIFILIIVYSLITKLFGNSKKVDNGLPSETRNIFYRVNSFSISWNEVFNFEILLFTLLNLFSTFMFLASTYFLTLGLSFLFYYCSLIYSLIFPVYGNYFEGRINNKLIKVLCKVLFFFGFIQIIANCYNFFSNNKEENLYNFEVFVCGLLLCLSANYLNFKQKLLMNTHFKEKSPFQIVLVLYMNLTIITLLILFLYMMIFDKFNILNLFGWIFSFKIFYEVGLGIGLLAFSQIVISILNSIFLETFWIKFILIIEPLIADMIAIFLVFLYGLPIESSYYIGILQITIARFFSEFPTFFNKFEKTN